MSNCESCEQLRADNVRLLDEINKLKHEDANQQRVTRMVSSPPDSGRIYCVYLSDGTKIVIKRDEYGGVWMVCEGQARLRPAVHLVEDNDEQG
jgi:hypothetical protein